MTALRGRVKEQAELLAWCPAEHRELYTMLHDKHFTAAEARVIIEDHIAVLERRMARAAK